MSYELILHTPRKDIAPKTTDSPLYNSFEVVV